MASFLEYETCGGGWNFVLGVSKGLPIYLALAQSFDFSLQIFEFRQKWFFEAQIIEGPVPSGHLALNPTVAPGVFVTMMNM